MLEYRRSPTNVLELIVDGQIKDFCGFYRLSDDAGVVEFFRNRSSQSLTKMVAVDEHMNVRPLQGGQNIGTIARGLSGYRCRGSNVFGEPSLSSSNERQDDSENSDYQRRKCVDVISKGVQPIVNNRTKHDPAVGGAIMRVLLGMCVVAIIVAAAPFGSDTRDRDIDKNQNR
jgi:hypothetical protein